MTSAAIVTPPPATALVLPSTMAGLGWPPNAGSPRWLPRRLVCGVRGGGDVSDFKFRGLIPEWLDADLAGHLHVLPPAEVHFTSWEPNPIRAASAVIAHAPEYQKEKLLECMRELQRLGVPQDPDERQNREWLEHHYRNSPSYDLSSAPEMLAWQRWATTRHVIRAHSLLGDLVSGTLYAFGEPERIGAHPEWITPPTWMELNRDESSPGKFVGGGNTYWRVRVVRPADVLAMQPKAQELKQKAAAPSQAGTAEFTMPALGAWFVLRERTWPKDQPTPNEEADRVAAEAYFRNFDLSRDAFRRLRREKTSEAWKKIGRRKGLSNSP